MKIAPGLRVNFGKRGLSLSAGVRGASINVGPRGAYTNVGIPGTSLSYRQKVSGVAEQRRVARSQQRLAREYERLEKARARQEALSKVQLSLDKENGTVAIVDAFGNPLSRKDIGVVWDQQQTAIGEWLEQQAAEINGDVELLTKIHEDTPSPDSEPEYEVLPFSHPPPEQPQAPYEEPKPERTVLPPLGFFTKLFKRKRLKHDQQRQQLNAEYATALTTWEQEKKRRQGEYQAAVESFNAEREEWENRKKVHEADETQRKLEFPQQLRINTELMSSTLEDALNSLSWPRETLVSYQIMEDGRQVWLDVDLPEIEDLPQKVAVVAASGRKLNIKAKPVKQLHFEYAAHIHGIVFCLAGTLFATLPAADTVTISGFSQRLDKSTGKVNDEYLLSVKMTRESYAEIDFENIDKVDPMEAISAFEIRRKLTSTGIFRAIEPFEPGIASIQRNGILS